MISLDIHTLHNKFAFNIIGYYSSLDAISEMADMIIENLYRYEDMIEYGND
jgi:hypothetical protein